MTTLAPDALDAFADAFEYYIDTAARRDDAATFAGIVGDLQHRLEGGYHISRQDQPANNYSCILPEDREGASEDASAVDMKMSEKYMILVTGRLLASAKDKNDPRLDCLREFYGTLDGETVTGWDCYYYRAQSSDDSHLWHLHLSFLRKYARSAAAANAVLSVIKGETLDQYLGEDDEVKFDDIVTLRDGRTKFLRDIIIDLEEFRNLSIGDGAFPKGFPREGSPYYAMLNAAKGVTAAEIASEIIKQIKE